MTSSQRFFLSQLELRYHRLYKGPIVYTMSCIWGDCKNPANSREITTKLYIYLLSNTPNTTTLLFRFLFDVAWWRVLGWEVGEQKGENPLQRAPENSVGLLTKSAVLNIWTGIKDKGRCGLIDAEITFIDHLCLQGHCGVGWVESPVGPSLVLLRSNRVAGVQWRSRETPVGHTDPVVKTWSWGAGAEQGDRTINVEKAEAFLNMKKTNTIESMMKGKNMSQGG